jgi:hypothetical protein
VVGGAAEHRKVAYVPSRNMSTDCFEQRGIKVNAIKNIYNNNINSILAITTTAFSQKLANETIYY